MSKRDNRVSQHFNANWDQYRKTVDGNALYHKEMFETINQFLRTHFSHQDFTLVDLGCGDSRSIASVLINKPIKKYIGIDSARDVIKLATESLSQLNCEKKLICEEMSTAIMNLESPADIIFTSYAVHHLSLEKKANLIAACKQKLAPQGFFVMLDGVLKENQSREEWLATLAERFKLANPGITAQELQKRMEHPRHDDHPETISTFEALATKQHWKNFKVLMQKEIYALMVFEK